MQRFFDTGPADARAQTKRQYANRLHVRVFVIGCVLGILSLFRGFSWWNLIGMVMAMLMIQVLIAFVLVPLTYPLYAGRQEANNEQ